MSSSSRDLHATSMPYHEPHLLSPLEEADEESTYASTTAPPTTSSSGRTSTDAAASETFSSGEQASISAVAALDLAIDDDEDVSSTDSTPFGYRSSSTLVHRDQKHEDEHEGAHAEGFSVSGIDEAANGHSTYKSDVPYNSKDEHHEQPNESVHRRHKHRTYEALRPSRLRESLRLSADGNSASSVSSNHSSRSQDIKPNVPPKDAALLERRRRSIELQKPSSKHKLPAQQLHIPLPPRASLGSADGIAVPGRVKEPPALARVRSSESAQRVTEHGHDVHATTLLDLDAGLRTPPLHALYPEEARAPASVNTIPEVPLEALDPRLRAKWLVEVPIAQLVLDGNAEALEAAKKMQKAKAHEYRMWRVKRDVRSADPDTMLAWINLVVAIGSRSTHDKKWHAFLHNNNMVDSGIGHKQRQNAKALTNAVATLTNLPVAEQMCLEVHLPPRDMTRTFDHARKNTWTIRPGPLPYGPTVDDAGAPVHHYILWTCNDLIDVGEWPAEDLADVRRLGIGGFVGFKGQFSLRPEYAKGFTGLPGVAEIERAIRSVFDPKKYKVCWYINPLERQTVLGLPHLHLWVAKKRLPGLFQLWKLRRLIKAINEID